MAIFVHLDDTDPSNGGLGIFPGSHLKGPQVNNPSLTLNLDCVHVSGQGIRTLSRSLHASRLITITTHDYFKINIQMNYSKSLKESFIHK